MKVCMPWSVGLCHTVLPIKKSSALIVSECVRNADKAAYKRQPIYTHTYSWRAGINIRCCMQRCIFFLGITYLAQRRTCVLCGGGRRKQPSTASHGSVDGGDSMPFGQLCCAPCWPLAVVVPQRIVRNQLLRFLCCNNKILQKKRKTQYFFTENCSFCWLIVFCTFIATKAATYITTYVCRLAVADDAVSWAPCGYA